MYNQSHVFPGAFGASGRSASSLASSTTMAATARLHQQPMQSSLHNGLQDHAIVADQTQYLSAVFCRALYDYESRDASSLSFRKGDVIEVLTRLDSGWWDGLLNDERGWFPSNYVAPVSEQEIEQELRAVRMDSCLPEDSCTEPTGPPNDFWVPQVSANGRIFYVNTQTGERSNELPTEVDSDTEPLIMHNASSATLAPSVTDSVASSVTAVATTEPPAADFGLPKRSGTPEPWVKRLTDDGMTYYYLNTVDASIRWTAPSPQFDSLPQELPPDLGGRQRADSSATRTSVYTDDSDSNLLGILGRGAALARSTSNDATTLTPGDQPDDAPEVRAAKDLQAILQDQFSPIPDSLEDLAQAARAAVTDLMDAALVRDNNTLVRDAVKRTADAVRNLVYASKTLVGSLSSLPPPYTGDSAPSDITELKNYHRKVTATMVKFVSAIRSLDSDTTHDDTPARLEHEAGEVERAITAFVNEVLRKRAPNPSTRHVRAVLCSPEGRRGVGLELLGAGAAGKWKGFGFVDSVEGRLGAEIIETVNQHKVKVDNALFQLESVLSAGQVPAIVLHGQEGLRCLVLFLGLIADINVARALDFDSTTSIESSYAQSVGRAKELVRALEATVQAAFEDGAVLLNVIQSVSATDTVVRAGIRPWDLLIIVLPNLRSNVANVCSNVMALLEIAQSQAEACATAGVVGLIGLRDASLYDDAHINPDHVPNGSGFQPRNGVGDVVGHSRDASEEDIVDLGDVLVARPATRSDRNDIDRNMYGIVGRGRSDTSVDASYDSTGGTRGHGDVGGRNSPAILGNMGQPTNYLPLAKVNSPLADDELADEEDIRLGTVAKSPERRPKYKDILGHDAPDTYNTNDDAKPWYLRPEHGAKDIWINPEGGIRGGTLPALIERLTMHDKRDMGFNSTFLVTFKSFTTLNELFDGLVERFYITHPENLSPSELKEWTEQKQVLVRFRVINVLRQMVTDDNVLEKEDMHILERIKGFAATVDQEVVPPIPAAKQLLSLVERAQSGGDTIIKRMQITPSFPPAPIVPKANRAMKLLDIEPLELARQLTIMESKLFAKIRPMECLNRGRDGKPGDSDDNISAIIDTSNKVAEWVADSVLSKDDSKKRAAIVKQFIAVADRCRLLQNFSTMAALVAGLNSPPIRRLKRTWEQVNARSKAQLQEAERTMDTNKNFTNYRAILKSAQLPCVPFFGVYLSVLTFIQDGNKNMIQGDIINFSKREKFAEVVREIKHYQSKPYNLTVIPTIQNFIDESISALGNTADLSDRAWNLSLEREPREREDEKMARLLQENGSVKVDIFKSR